MFQKYNLKNQLIVILNHTEIYYTNEQDVHLFLKARQKL
jgi:hypothetical protein